MAKEKNCKDCVFYQNKECTHKSNIGLLVKYRKEQEYFIKKPDEINKTGRCSKYVVKLSKK